MSPAIVRTLCGSCLALGVVDLAWLDLNASKVSVRTSSSSVGEQSIVAAGPATFLARAPAPMPAPPTAPPPAAIEPPLPTPLEESAVHEEVTSCAIQFERSNASLRPEEAASLTAIAETLKRHPRAVVRVAGHADRVAWKGNRSDNLTLSDHRARAVVDALGKLGIAPNRIRSAAFGDAKPIDGRASEEAYRRNRRVEVRVELTGDH